MDSVNDLSGGPQWSWIAGTCISIVGALMGFLWRLISARQLGFERSIGDRMARIEHSLEETRNQLSKVDRDQARLESSFEAHSSRITELRADIKQISTKIDRLIERVMPSIGS